MAILDLLKTAEDPKYPGLVLTLHVIAKNVEMGSLLGLALGVIGGTVGFVTKKKHPIVRLLKMCEFGICMGTLAGLITVGFKSHFDETMNADGIQDRAYRLIHSKPGIKHEMDVRFVYGGFAGAAIVALLPESWIPLDLSDRLAQGYCLGAAIAALPLTTKVAQKMATKKLQMM